MFNPSIDLGQLILAGTITTLGFLVKWELARITVKIDKHDDMLFKLMALVGELLGASRRRNPDRGER